MENTPKGSITWNLCRKGLEFFVHHLYRIPGNGRQTFLWDDKINGHAPLNSYFSIIEIKNWLMNKGIYRLVDITSWDANGNWNAWSLPTMTERNLSNFYAQQKSLLDRLSGMAPIHRSCKDMWGWGFFGFYFAANGFKQLQFSSQICSMASSGSHNATFWKMVWNLPSIPNFFLLHLDYYASETLNWRKLVKKRFFWTIQMLLLSSSC